MANTYTQLYAQIVFAVEARQCLIAPDHKEELHKYITGVVRERGQKLLAIHCMPDHTHVLIGFRPTIALSDLVRDMKTASSNFITRQGWVAGRFSWQEGFGAFSYGHSQIGAVVQYIENQVTHHDRWGFRQEYLRFLQKFEVRHDEMFIFKDVSGGSGLSCRSLDWRLRARGSINRPVLKDLDLGSPRTSREGHVYGCTWRG